MVLHSRLKRFHMMIFASKGTSALVFDRSMKNDFVVSLICRYLESKTVRTHFKTTSKRYLNARFKTKDITVRMFPSNFLKSVR